MRRSGARCRSERAQPVHLADVGDLYVQTKYEAHQVALEFAAAGMDVTLVCPTGPIGPGDIGPTPTGRLLLSALHLPVIAVPRTSNNLGDVHDIDEGHVLAGIDKPVFLVPHVVLGAIARAWLCWAERVSGRPPLITPSAARIGARGLRADCSKAVAELGLPGRPIAESVRDALVWFARRGYVRNRRARETLLRVCESEPADRSARAAS